MRGPMDKEKWKDFPCKNCLLKGKCQHRCFRYPAYITVIEYIQHEGLRNTCLGCGGGVNTYTLNDERGCQGGCKQCTGYHYKNERT